MIAVETSSDAFDTVLEVGAVPFGAFSNRQLPPIDQTDMTPAMTLARRLAGALTSRLDAVLPEPFT